VTELTDDERCMRKVAWGAWCVTGALVALEFGLAPTGWHGVPCIWLSLSAA